MHSFKQMVPNRMRKFARDMQSATFLKYRQATWRHRPLPDFIILGAQRAGSTSLYRYLQQHPQLSPSYVKEVHFFDGGLNPKIDNFKKGEAWYRAHFRPIEHTNTRKKTFEDSPLYLFNPLVPKRIADLVPEVKLVVLLRNPTERAISQYFHEKRIGHETLGIMDALQAEEERLRPILESDDYKNDIFIHQSYKSRGLYRDQLKRYLDYFPIKNFLVVNSEKFFAEPNAMLRRVFEFLGVDSVVSVSNLEPRNTAIDKSVIAPGVREYLNDYFSGPNRALYDLVGENYGW